MSDLQLPPTGYLESVVALLHERRPELLGALHGFVGPTSDERVAGLIFRRGRLLVVVSPWDTDEGLWLHVSVSTPTRCPTYDELTRVRRSLFRDTDTVLHVWPPASEHYSLHPYCLHLWTPMDGTRPIPDLRGNEGGV